MSTRTNPGFLIIMAGVIMLMVFGSQLAASFLQSDDIWWTPLPMAEPYDDSGERVEIFINNLSLDEILAREDLLLVMESETVAVKGDDIRLRFNNYNSVMASKIPFLLIDTVFTTLGLVLIVIGVIPFFTRRNGKVEITESR